MDMMGGGSNNASPDVVNKVTCWRGFIIQGQELISPTTFTIWNENKQTAQCNIVNSLKEYSHDFTFYEKEFENHHAPVQTCCCGLYGFYDKEHLGKNYGDIINVATITDFWGRTEVHPHGLRSQYAQIKAVAPAKRNRLTIRLTINSKRKQKYSLQNKSFSKEEKRRIYRNVFIDYLIVCFLPALFWVLTINGSNIKTPAIVLTVSMVLYMLLWLTYSYIPNALNFFKLKRWANKNNVIFAKNLEELEKYNTNRFPNSLKPKEQSKEAFTVNEAEENKQ